MVDRRHTPLERVVINAHHCTASEQRRLLGGAPFFARLTVAEVDDLAASFHQSDYAVGDLVHHAGDPALRLSVIAAGMVKMIRPTINGQNVLLDILGPGDHFGSLAELGDAVYREDAVAHTDCCILYTTAEEFARVLRRYPAVTLATLKLVAARLREAQETIEQISAYSVDRRIASTLLKLATRVGRSTGDATLIEMPLSRQDLAEMTGTTIETVSRVLSEFRRSGLIDSGRRWIAVRDDAALAEIAQSGKV